MSRVIFHRREAPDDSGEAQLAHEGKLIEIFHYEWLTIDELPELQYLF